MSSSKSPLRNPPISKCTTAIFYILSSLSISLGACVDEPVEPPIFNDSDDSRSDSLSYSERIAVLWEVANGRTPLRHTRLGAFRAAIDSSGQISGTVGQGVAGCIAGIYLLWGNAGERNIGNIFNSQHARALMRRPNHDTDAHRELATIEYNYWVSEHEKNSDFYTWAAVNVSVENRVRLQQTMGLLDMPGILSSRSKMTLAGYYPQ